MHLRLGQSLEQIAGHYDILLPPFTRRWRTTTTIERRSTGHAGRDAFLQAAGSNAFAASAKLRTMTSG